MTTSFVEGIDVSNHNGTVGWQSVAGAGRVFAFIKASEGSSFTDPLVTTNVLGARAAGIIVGLYHFYRHDGDPIAQAEHFSNLILALYRPGDLPPTVDVETETDGAGAMGGTSAQRVSNIGAFIGRVKVRTGLDCMVYTYPSGWQVVTGNSGALTDFHLWVASYGAGLTKPKWTGPWSDYTFWQYSDNGTVPGAGHVDLDRFNGTLDELKAFCGLQQQPPAPPAPPAPQPDTRFFPETGHNLSHGFLDFWNANGGLTIFGYPITEEIQEDGQTVQYFERARMEYVPPSDAGGAGVVRLGLVGAEAAKARGIQV